MERGIQHFGASSAKPLPDDFMVAVKMIQEMSQNEMTFVFLLVIAFIALALLPFDRSKREDSHDA
jgi:hypothetical protein